MQPFFLFSLPNGQFHHPDGKAIFRVNKNLVWHSTDYSDKLTYILEPTCQDTIAGDFFGFNIKCIGGSEKIAPSSITITGNNTKIVSVFAYGQDYEEVIKDEMSIKFFYKNRQGGLPNQVHVKKKTIDMIAIHTDAEHNAWYYIICTGENECAFYFYQDISPDEFIAKYPRFQEYKEEGKPVKLREVIE